MITQAVILIILCLGAIATLSPLIIVFLTSIASPTSLNSGFSWPSVPTLRRRARCKRQTMYSTTGDNVYSVRDA